MKISTRGRYGVRMMLDLAMHEGHGPVSLKDIAARQEISEKYLSNIVPPLRNAGLVVSVRGSRGGYALGKKPREITLKDILLVLEGPMCLVECTGQPKICRRADECLMRDIWAQVSDRILDTLGTFDLETMVEQQKSKEHAATYEI